MPQDEMTFSVAHGIMSEIVRRNRGMEKLEDVLKAAERAENFVKTMEGKMKNAEGKKSALDALLADLTERIKESKADLIAQMALAKKTHAGVVKEIAQKEREVRTKYTDLESSLKAGHKSKKEAADEALVQAKERLASLKAERKTVQTQLDALTGTLKSVVEKFSVTV